MIDIHTSFRTNPNFSNISKTKKNDTQPLLFSARPKIQQLPFLNNLKLARKLLVALKNQKLRKSLYVVTQGSEGREKEDGELLKQEKAKLSVMQLISEEGKFQELSNTIKTNLNKQSQGISPIIMDKKSSLKQDTHEFSISGGICQALKGEQREEVIKGVGKIEKKQKPSVITRKNQLASQLNKLGHELQQTYFEVDQLEKIFGTLCNYYADNKKVVETNLKRKEEKDLLKEQLQEYEGKIMKNKQKQIQLKDQLEDFELACRRITKSYLQDLIPYNRQIEVTVQQIQPAQSNLFKQELVYNLQSNFKQPEQQDQQKQLQLNLKFKHLKGQLEKMKTQKKNTQQNKNNQKRNKIQAQQNTFNKLYVSEIYSL